MFNIWNSYSDKDFKNKSGKKPKQDVQKKLDKDFDLAYRIGWLQIKPPPLMDNTMT